MKIEVILLLAVLVIILLGVSLVFVRSCSAPKTGDSVTPYQVMVLQQLEELSSSFMEISNSLNRLAISVDLLVKRLRTD
jgi:flagellar basal body-associated protein FliL